MSKRNLTFLLIVLLSIVSSCKTIDPVKQSDSFFSAFLAKRYAEIFYTMEKTSAFEEVIQMLDPETSGAFDKAKLNDMMRERAGSIIGGDERFETEILQEINLEPNFRFVYLIKKEDFGFFSSKYRKIRIDRVICVDRSGKWFIYGLMADDVLHLGIDTIFQITVKELAEQENQSLFLREIVKEDYEKTKLEIFSHENPDLTRDEIVEELIEKGIQLYDEEKYRESLRLFKKALSISDGRSDKASTYYKRCQKAIEMGL